MEKSFIAFLTEFMDANDKKILDQPERFKSLFLDFSQNEYRAEAQIFSQFLASKQAQELKISDDVDTVLLNGITERFYQTYFFDKEKCGLSVMACAWFLGLIDEKTFETGIDIYAVEGQNKVPTITVGNETAVESAQYNVILQGHNAGKKTAVIKEIRSVTGLGLQEARDLVEWAPKPIKKRVSKEEADGIDAQITAVGGIVKIRPAKPAAKKRKRSKSSSSSDNGGHTVTRRGQTEDNSGCGAFIGGLYVILGIVGIILFFVNVVFN